MRRSLHKIALVMSPLLLSCIAHAQLRVTGGAHIVATPGVSILLNNIGLDNDGNISTAAGSLVFTGTTSSAVTDFSSNTPINKITVNKPGGGVRLVGNLELTDTLQFTAGVLDLNGYNLDLGATGILYGETGTAYVTGTNGGYVQRTATLNAPVSADPGNLGLQITSSSNMGSTIIRRGHLQQTNSTATQYGIYRYYDVIPATNTGLNASVRFNYFDHELAGITEGDLHLYTSTNNGNTWTSHGADALNTSANYLEKNGLGSFGRLTLGNQNAPLLLNLLGFSGRENGEGVMLSWTTSAEVDVKGFEVEKSMDARNFIPFTFVQSTANTSAAVNNYNTTDKEPYSIGTYYRLKMLNKNGTFSYSQVISIRNSNTASMELSLYPNPAYTSVQLMFNSVQGGIAKLQVLDMLGQVVIAKDVAVAHGMNNIDMDVSFLRTGTYFIRLNGAEYGNRQFIKSN